MDRWTGYLDIEAFCRDESATLRRGNGRGPLLEKGSGLYNAPRGSRMNSPPSHSGPPVYLSAPGVDRRLTGAGVSLHAPKTRTRPLFLNSP